MKERQISVVIHQDYRALSNSLTMCMFPACQFPVQLALVNAVTGLDWSLEDVHAGRRANMESKKGDQPSVRFDPRQ